MAAASYQNIPRLYTAICEFLACALYVGMLPRKATGWRLVLHSILAFAVIAAWLVLTGNVPIYLWLLCMAAAVMLMFLYIHNTVRGDWQRHFYFTMKALLAAEFAASLEWQIEYYILRQQRQQNTPLNMQQHIALSVVLMGLVLGISALVLYYTEHHMLRGEYEFEITRKECTTAAMIAILVFLLSNLSFVNIDTPFSGRLLIDIFNIRTLTDLVGMAILYAYQSRVFELNAERELNAINAQLAAQYEHYRNYQQSIDLINFKYHDLKHQLAGLRAEPDPAKRGEWIDSMSRELETYQPETQTGNHVLDGVIDGKMAMIRNNRVKFTCVADGRLLDFMHVTDICTIFGNALDNAIEYVITVEDPDKRLIHMSVSAKKNFLCIEISNYCEQQIRLVNGTPVTTKKDRKMHGFGTKSILYTAQKYGGSVNYSQENNVFHAKVIIPVPES